MTGARRALARKGMLAALCLLAAACRDRGGARPEAPPPVDAVPRRVEVRLLVARDWAWNEEDSLRVTVLNATEQPVSGELNLLVGGGVAVLADSAAARATDSLPAPRREATAEGTRVVIPLGTLAPGTSREFRQAVRTPPAPAVRPRGAAAADTVSRFAVRAWLAAADGRELAQAADTIRIRPGSDVVAGGCGGVRDVAVTRYGIGPLRLDMRGGDVRTLCPEARDTTWPGAEGMTERGMAVRLAGHPVLLVLAGDTVHRIVVDSAGLRTSAGMGVGSTLAELRGRYGRLCAGEAEGKVAVWFPTAPGISFGLRREDTGDWAAEGQDPAALPASAVVDGMWVRDGGMDDCPASPGG